MKLGRAPAIKANRLVDVMDGQKLFSLIKKVVNQDLSQADGGSKTSQIMHFEGKVFNWLSVCAPFGSIPQSTYPIALGTIR
jgi:hypothetical protein